jgi:flagellar biosynthesis protein
MGKMSGKSRQAVALRYKPGEDNAPRVVGKGRGYLADKILEVARAHNIPIREDRNLVQILSRLDLDQQIPAELYRAVAEILAFIYRVGQQASSPDKAGS